jgi:hypothetical protein
MEQMKPFGSGLPVVPPKPEATVTVTVTETHDGQVCDCIDQEMTLRVGDELTLDHVCNDGRVDKVIAKVKAIKVERTEPEHGTATVQNPMA